MKGKFLSVVILLLALMISMASCHVSDGTGDSGSSSGSGQTGGSSGGSDTGSTSPDSGDEGNGGSADTLPTGYIYENGSELKIVFSDSRLFELATALKDRITNYSTATVTLVSDTEEKYEHEIILGVTDRPLSGKAYRRLSRMYKSEGNTAYTLYSDGSSVAVAFDDDFYGSAMANSVGYLSESIIAKNSSLSLPVGRIAEREYDPLEGVRELDKKRQDEQFAALAEEITEKYGEGYAEATVEALRDYYSLYTDNLVLWFANLYDPAVGGYYYSNSARDTVGFLPDVESTTQSLNFIVGSGMAQSVGGRYSDVISDTMREEIVGFVRGLQDKNGYFYHPQWGKELTDVNVSRRSRDLNWATGILKALGANPIYDTPSGMKGESASPVSMMGMLGSSVTAAVSRAVIPTASSATVSAQLRTKEALLEYLDAFDMKNDSYFAGNELASQAGEILERDKQLESAGADWRASEVIIDFLNRKQIPETGTWHYERNYMGVNGLLKISSLYNSLGAKINYPLVAAESAIAAITTSEEPLTICYAYNAWFSVTNIQKNLREYSDDKEEGEKQAAALSLAIMENAPESIRATKEKYLKFLKYDGSFSYNQTSSAANAQGLPVAIPGTNEGDVNATEIGTAGVLGHIYGALGLRKVPFFGDSHRLLYLHTIDSLGAVIKDAENGDIGYVTYDEDSPGREPSDVTGSRTSSGSLTVIRDEREGKTGNVLKLVSVNDGGDTLVYSCDSMRADLKCFVFETEMCVTSSDVSGNIMQIYLGNKAYMLNVKVENGKIRLSDVSSGSNPRLENDFGVEIELGKWFHLKAEYYAADEENVRAKVYVDGELVGVTDNYYDASAARLNGKRGKPNQHYTEASVYAMSYHNMEVLFDNTASYKTRTPFRAVTPLDKQPHVNIDDDKHILGPADPDTGNGAYYNNEEITDATRFHYGMMGYPMPALSGSLYASSSVEGGMLKFKRTAAAGSGESYINFRVIPPTGDFASPATVIEFDFRFSGGDISADNAPLRLDDGNYVRFVKNSDGASFSLGKKDTAEIVAGEWFNICLEIYYLGEFCEYAKVFVDGEYTTTVRLVNMSPFNERLLVYLKKNMEKDTEINIDNMFFWHTEKKYVPESAEYKAPDINIAYTDAPATGEYFGSQITEGAVRFDYSDGAVPSLSGSAALVLNKNESALMMKIDSGEGYISYSLSPSITALHPATVFEFDYKMSGLDPTYDNAPIRLDGGNHLRFLKNTDGVSWSIAEKDTAKITANKWYNIRLEIYYVTEESEIVKVFVDGEHTATVNLTEASAFNSRVLFYMKNGAAKDAVIFIDNVFYCHLDKEYVAPDSGEGEGGEGTEPTPPEGGGGEGGGNTEGGSGEGTEPTPPEGGGSEGGSDNEGSGAGSIGGGASGDVVEGAGTTLLPGPDMSGDGWSTPNLQ